MCAPTGRGRCRTAMCSRAPCLRPPYPRPSRQKKPHSRRGLWIFLIVLAVLVGTVLGVAVVTALRSGDAVGYGDDYRRRRSRRQQHRGHLWQGDIPTIPRADIGPRSVRFYCQDAAEEKLTIQQVYAAGEPGHRSGGGRDGREGQHRHRRYPDGGRLYRHQRPCDRRRTVRRLWCWPMRGSYEAELVGFDSDRGSGGAEGGGRGRICPPRVLGDSDECWVGDTVYAIGNPLGVELRGTLTQGIISAIDRRVTMDGTRDDACSRPRRR